MARTKQRKVGDRIFYEYYDGTIGTAIIKRIEPVVDTHMDKYGNRLKEGKVFKYKEYYTGVNTVIADYNCLPDNDPRVKEYCKGKKFITSGFADELRKFLVEHGAHKGDNDVVQILYDLANEFEGHHVLLT